MVLLGRSPYLFACEEAQGLIVILMIRRPDAPWGWRRSTGQELGEADEKGGTFWITSVCDGTNDVVHQHTDDERLGEAVEQVIPAGAGGRCAGAISRDQRDSPCRISDGERSRCHGFTPFLAHRLALSLGVHLRGEP